MWVRLYLGVSIKKKKVKISSKRLFLGIFNHLHMKRSTEWGTSFGTFDGLATAIFCWHPQVLLVLLPCVLYLAPLSVPTVFSMVALFQECHAAN